MSRVNYFILWVHMGKSKVRIWRQKIKVNGLGRLKLGQGIISWQWAKHAWLYSDMLQALNSRCRILCVSKVHKAKKKKNPTVNTKKIISPTLFPEQFWNTEYKYWTLNTNNETIRCVDTVIRFCTKEIGSLPVWGWTFLEANGEPRCQEPVITHSSCDMCNRTDGEHTN